MQPSIRPSGVRVAVRLPPSDAQREVHVKVQWPGPCVSRPPLGLRSDVLLQQRRPQLRQLAGGSPEAHEDRLPGRDVERIDPSFAAVVAGERKAVEVRRWSSLAGVVVSDIQRVR